MSDEIRRLFLDASFAAPGNKSHAENALCPICKDYIEDAKEVNCKARHVFCGPCITKEYERRQTEGLAQKCPTCRGPFSTLETSPPQLRNFIEEVEWKCLNHEDGCGFTGTKKKLEKHLDEECPEQETKCPFQGCTQKMKRGPLAAHKVDCKFRLIPCELCEQPVRFGTKTAHSKACKKVRVSCPNRCGQKCLRGEIAEHKKTDCKEQLVNCPVAGCGDRVKRKKLDEHDDASVKKHFKLLQREVEIMKSPDTVEGTVRLPNFKAKAPRLGKNDRLQCATFSLKGHRFCLEVYPGGYGTSESGKAGLFVRNLDDFKGVVIYSVRVLNGNGIPEMQLMKDFSGVRDWGFSSFCPASKLLDAAAATEGGALEFHVSLTAEKTHKETFALSGYRQVPPAWNG
uniref:RING-type domain-containing protein n=1 Tax=Chromera velia CCMP2878 TaxID=1169474 RepID=A0A0G4F8U1_9ALVE|eukprot:Cvel_15677.t1-p1 / transcript=Cvel_15677.t1 / gene=Cvel_15677 / organism=Chromera_velia_CCMP2878 / gene_product=TNF receptor-associated factor 4, putative / transcript_product=TNF receptor-associated factor 4, putative / location=Cvel_scaffold1170:34363-36732(+) / protein_length=398 / sequence_SO=supercontig / SO=protein_coding / is_pseudo=false